MLPRPVPFIWQCVLRYHDQCLSPGNVSYGTMTSAFHLAMCHTVPRPMYFTWQCVIRYHDQCLSPGNVSYATMTSVYHLAMCHTVPWLVLFTCQYVIRYHNQCNMTMRHTVPRPVQHDNAPYGNTTSVFHLVICHTVPRPVSFTLQCVIRYHDQRLSYGTKVESLTPSSDKVYFFSDLGQICDFLRIQPLKDDINFFLNQKTKMAICTKRENVIGANRRHFYQVVSV
jgi:hypothetical protein